MTSRYHHCEGADGHATSQVTWRPAQLVHYTFRASAPDRGLDWFRVRFAIYLVTAGLTVLVGGFGILFCLALIQ